MSDDMRNATQGALALYLNEVQPVDGRVQINVSIDELTVLRGLAATPAVGGERLWCTACGTVTRNLRCDCNSWPDGHEMKREPHFVNYADTMQETAHEQAQQIAKLEAQLASQPASPLRGRELDMLSALKNVQKIIAEGALTGFNYKDGNWAERLFESQQVTSAAIKKAAAAASPPEQPAARKWTGPGYLEQTGYIDPEQPAAYPSAEADEEHADLLRRLAAVPKDEKE